MEALEKGNKIRSDRAQFKRRLKVGKESIVKVLLDPPAFLATAKVFEVLLAVPSIGRVKANSIMTKTRISPSKTVGGLSDRQRDELIRTLREREAKIQARSSGEKRESTATPDLMATLEISPDSPQHIRALSRANKVRLARAQLKVQVAAGERLAAEVILSSPWEAESMSVSDLLLCQRRWGWTRCRRVLLSLGLPENKQIGTMTERQRIALASILVAKAARKTQETHVEAPTRVPELAPA